VPEFYPIVEKFLDSTLLRCIDVHRVQVEHNKQWQSPFDGEWYERRWSTTWDVATRLANVRQRLRVPSIAIGHRHNDLEEYARGFDRYSSMNLLTDHILKSCRPVRFRQGTPLHPFATVSLDTFDLEPGSTFLESAHPDIPMFERDDVSDEMLFMLAMNPVDGKQSCAFHIQCTELPQSGSDFCTMHHDAIVEALTTAPKGHLCTRKMAVQDSQQDSQQDTQWIQPSDISCVRVVHEVDDKFEVWCIDVEFSQVRAVSTIPYILTVRDEKTGAIVLSTTVDYDGRGLQDVEDALEQHQQSYGSTVHKGLSTVRYFSKFYKSEHTHGMTLAAIGDYLRSVGFNPNTHRITSWFSGVDCVIFHRAILGHSQLLDYTPYHTLIHLPDEHGDSCLQPYSLSHTLKACSNISSQRCGYVYRSFCDEDLEMHWPDANPLAMYRLYQLFLEVSGQWVADE
jgi:hypothetical protein